MRRLLAFAEIVDRLTEFLGQWLKWLVLFSSVISAFNALMRYTIHYSSNAWLEIQWYMFGAMFLLGGGLCAAASMSTSASTSSIGKLSPSAAWVDIAGGSCSSFRWR